MKDNTIKNTKDSEQLIVGVPTMGLLPARKYTFKVKEDTHKITIPIRGKLKDLDPDFFNTEEYFEIVNDDKSIINFVMITKILFASSSYPSLEYNELFCPTRLVINDNTLDIYGQVVVMLNPNKESDEAADKKCSGTCKCKG